MKVIHTTYIFQSFFLVFWGISRTSFLVLKGNMTRRRNQAIRIMMIT